MWFFCLVYSQCENKWYLQSQGLLQSVFISVNILQFGQICFAIWTNMFYCLDKYVFCLDKYVLLFGQICFLLGQIFFAFWTNMFSVGTNIFCHLNKSVVLHGTPAIPNSIFCNVSNALSSGNHLDLAWPDFQKITLLVGLLWTMVRFNVCCSLVSILAWASAAVSASVSAATSYIS